MKKKLARLELISKILTENEIHSQADLLGALEAAGCKVTQATLSRDLKMLKVAKTSNENNEYQYKLASSISQTHFNFKSESKTAADGQISLDFSGNLAVIHTRPGYAALLALSIDAANIKGILGTVAGDDTILAVLSPDAAIEDIPEQLAKVFE